VLCVAAIVGIGAAFTLWRQAIADFAQVWFWHGDKVSAPPSAWDWVYYFSPYLRVLEFIAGMLTARIYQTKSLPISADTALTVGLIWCVGLSVASIANLSAVQYLVPNFAFAPGIALVMLGVCQGDGLLTRRLSSPAALFLGEISYSIYIWSFLMFAAFMLSGLMPITLHYFNSALKVLVLVGATIVVAYGSFELIEAPARRWLRQRLS